MKVRINECGVLEDKRLKNNPSCILAAMSYFNAVLMSPSLIKKQKTPNPIVDMNRAIHG
jgi:hypothetical protein